MNKAISKEDVERIRRCIVEMNNKWNFCKTTGVAPQTFDRILVRGFAREEQVKWMLDYCNQVEGIESTKYEVGSTKEDEKVSR